MSDDKTVYRAPVWHTVILLLASALLFFGGAYLAWHLYQTIGGPSFIFILFLPAPMMFAGIYIFFSALRHKVIVDEDSITVVDGIYGEQVVNKSQVDGFVIRDKGKTLEVKTTQKQAKTSIHTAVKIGSELKETLGVQKEVPEFRKTHFNKENYPVTLKHSLIKRALDILLLACLIYLTAPLFANLSSVLEKAKTSQELVMLCGVLALFFTVLLSIVHRRYRLILNLGITLHPDKIEVIGVFRNKIIHRDSITYFCHQITRRGFVPARVQISMKANADYYSKAYYLQTFGDFEKEAVFVDWFNSLQVPTDLEIPRLRQKY